MRLALGDLATSLLALSAEREAQSRAFGGGACLVVGAEALSAWTAIVSARAAKQPSSLEEEVGYERKRRLALEGEEVENVSRYRRVMRDLL